MRSQSPNHEVIYLHKQRPLIFNDAYILKHQKKTFDDIYDIPILKQLSFLINDDYQPCQCLKSINQCSKLKDILKESKKQEARLIFQRLKQNSLKQSQRNIFFDRTPVGLNEVLLPHLQNLLTTLNIKYPQILAQLLKHVKTDYSTFWIYGLYCSKFPSFQIIMKNIRRMTQQMRLDLDIQTLTSEEDNQLKRTYQMKLVNIFKGSFPSVVSIICESGRDKMIIEKFIICHYIRGKERKEFEIIKAAMQM